VRAAAPPLAGADEAKISSLLGVPWLMQGAAVVVSAALAWWVLATQQLLRERWWFIPVAFVLFAVSYVLGLKVLAVGLG
jgi:hypothetical protein